MPFHSKLSNDHVIDRIRGVQFTLMSPEEIRRRSVAEINSTNTYRQENIPIKNGIHDPRMGVIERGRICETCHQDYFFCPGHFGHIELARPMFYTHFLDYVIKTLRCVCFRCSKILVNRDDPKLLAILNGRVQNHKRFELVHKLCMTIKVCGKQDKNNKGNEDGCGAIQPKNYQREKDNISRILLSWDKREDTNISDGNAAADQSLAENRPTTLWADDVLAILSRITDSDAALMGYFSSTNRPEWMICTVFPVPPPAMRPSVRHETGQRMEDDLTHKISDIIKNNKILQTKLEDRENSKASTTNVEENISVATACVQYHIATFVNNQGGINMPQCKQRTSGRPLKSVVERIKSKEGRIRGNLMGKRVDFSARSVISPDANIGIDEVGVPLKIAMNLTFPEIVNPFNRNTLMEYVRNGPDSYPGANFIHKVDANSNRTYNLKTMDRNSIVLQNGDIVDRHMLNGDWVLFNRQPSLHKMSMLAHRARVMPHDTFRLNVCVTACYNADFDGDEMNLHMPQSYQTMNELKSLASVAMQIISPRTADPIVSIVQDVALGVYQITQDNVLLTEKQMSNLIISNTRFQGKLPPPEIKATKNTPAYWTGRQALSSVIPSNINMRMPNSQYDEIVYDKHGNKINDSKKDKRDFVIVKHGEITQGRIDKGIYQKQSNGLVHMVYNQNGPEATKELFNNTQRLICDFLVYHGFSVGISDLIINAETKMGLSEKLRQMKRVVYEKIQQLHMGEFENMSIYSTQEYFEMIINDELNKATNQLFAMGIAQVDDSNRMVSMIKSGSKGKKINLVQMVTALGQQNVDGQRITHGYDSRTLPHYPKYDDGPEARGFVENSLMKGLTPQEFFFHAMGGREGLIDTAVKSVTGDTPIVILENGIPKRVNIGDWIDERMAKAEPDAIEHHTERELELLSVESESIFIPTTDYHGNVSWGPITALTRHDPGTELFEIRTRGGRSVIVTECKSLLIWQPEQNQFKEIPTTEVKIGDMVPVTANLPTASNYQGFDPLCYGDEAEIAKLLQKQFIVREDTLESYPGTKEATEHLAMLCTRLGVYGDLVPSDLVYSSNSENPWVFTVRGSWAERLYSKLEFQSLVFEYNPLPNSSAQQLNDIVMDVITEIHVTPRAKFLDKYPKVYDLTVPTTFNFGLANGLQVRDTSSTGYLQRKLVKGMEDCKVMYDDTVRTAMDSIVQFVYGEDGMNSIKLESQKLHYINMDAEKLREAYWMHGMTNFKQLLTEEAYNNLMSKDNWEKTLDSEYQRVIDQREKVILGIFRGKNEDKLMYPINFNRIIQNAQQLFFLGDDFAGPFDMDPLWILKKNKELVERLYVNKNTPANGVLDILVTMWLSPKRVYDQHHLNRNALEYVYSQIERTFWESLVHPAEMVGVVAAQSIGEPTTQLTLNSFHTAGVAAGRKVVRGVPRLLEIVSVSKNIKAPGMTVYLKDTVNTNKARCLEINNEIQTTYLRDIIRSIQIYYDPNGMETEIENDREFMQRAAEIWRIADQECMGAMASPWVLRMEIFKEALITQGIKMSDIALALRQNSELCCVYSDDNAPTPLIMRVTIKPSEADEDMITKLKALEYFILEKLIIRGMNHINKSTAVENAKRMVYDRETMTFKKSVEWEIHTDGVNMHDVLAHKDVDESRTYTNDIISIKEVFGIEAARQAIIREMYDVLTGNAVEYRHLALLADTMTFKGYLMSIDRHGINRSEIGPLAKCAFEETDDMFIKAGIFAESDRMTGVAGNVMMGQIPTCGTGLVDLVMDQDKLPKGGIRPSALPRVQEEVTECLEENLNFDFEL